MSPSRLGTVRRSQSYDSAGRGLAPAGRRRALNRLTPSVVQLEDRRLLATFSVTSAADGGSAGTLRWAVAQANAASTPSAIAIELGRSPATITLTLGQLELTNPSEPVTIYNVANDGPVTISGGGENRVFEIDSGVSATISGLTLAGGSTSGNGGGIYNGGTLTLSNSTISGSSAYVGGGLYNTGTATLTDSTVSSNVGYGSAAGIFNRGSVTLADCTISGNSAIGSGPSVLPGKPYAGGGGGLFNHGTATLTDCTISGNSANNGGGFFNYGQATLVACTISGNSSPVGTSGGIIAYGYANYSGVHSSAATLTDTIVANNNSADFIEVTPYKGNVVPTAEVTGSNNLTGPTSFWTNGSDGNIILNPFASAGLSALGNYGGPTQTMAVLPGSAAIGAGTAVAGVTVDQRGYPLDSPAPDIGAFQSQGISITPVAGSTPQDTPAGDAFANPLAVNVASDNPNQSVVGEVVTFTVEPASNGASASLSSTTATIGADGVAQVHATANGTAGSYIVVASIGAHVTTAFALDNVIPLAFSGVSGVGMTYGTSSVTVTGTLSNDGQAPTGESVVVELNGLSQSATIGSNGDFSATLTSSGGLPVTGSPYTISYTYTGDGTFGPASTTSTLTVTPASPTVNVSDASGVYTGSPFVATASVTGIDSSPGSSLEGVSPTLAYYDGTYSSPSQLTGVEPLLAAPSQAGLYTVLATFGGSTDYSTASELATFTITRATPQVTWGPLASIVYGTPLGLAQLDASASVPGSFVYTPATGVLMDAGAGQSVSATFTPQDSTDYRPITATTVITVEQATPSLELSDSGGTYNGRPFAASVTITGAGDDDAPAASLGGVMPVLTYYDGAGISGANQGSTAPAQAGTYTVVASYAGSINYLAVRSAPVTFTINTATPTVALTASAGSTVFGQPITFVATVAAAIAPSGTVTFFDGDTALATVALDASGTAALTTSALVVGPHSITAAYSGAAGLSGAQSGPASASVAKSGTSVVLMPHPVLKKKTVKSEVLTAEIQPTTRGAGVPSGVVTFEIVTKKKKKTTTKVLGSAAVVGGAATVTLNPKLVLGNVITVLYSGDTDFQSSMLTAPKLSKTGLL
jgi:Bacterial Ig-like domain (group 3)